MPTVVTTKNRPMLSFRTLMSVFQTSPARLLGAKISGLGISQMSIVLLILCQRTPQTTNEISSVQVNGKINFSHDECCADPLSRVPGLGKKVQISPNTNYPNIKYVMTLVSQLMLSLAFLQSF